MFGGEGQKGVGENVSIILLFEGKSQFICLSSVIIIGDFYVGKNRKSQSGNSAFILSGRSGHAAKPGEV